MTADRKFNRTVRLNKDTAHILAVVRSIIEAQFSRTEETRLTDVDAIRLALEIAARSILSTEQASESVLKGEIKEVPDADTGGSKRVFFPSPYVPAALRGSHKDVDD